MGDDMYKITLESESTFTAPKVLHDPENGIFVLDAKLTKELNTSGTFTFRIDSSHNEFTLVYNCFMRRFTFVKVSRDNEQLWMGRIFRTTIDRVDNTMLVECEGELSFITDCMLKPYSFNGTPRQLLQYYADEIQPISDFDSIVVRNVTVQDPNNYIVRSNSDYSNAWDEISAKTFGSSLGGYLFGEISDDGTQQTLTLDWLAEPGGIGTQVIGYGDNLLSISDINDGTNIIRSVVPYGAKLTDGSPPTYVNLVGYHGDPPAGYNINYNTGAINITPPPNLYGVMAPVHFEDCETVSGLINAAAKYLSDHENDIRSLSVSAIDLHDIDVNVDALELGDEYEVRYKNIGTHTDASVSLVLVKYSLDLLHPESSTFEFGKLDNNNISADISSGGGSSVSGGGGGTDIPYIWRGEAPNAAVSDERDSESYIAALNQADMDTSGGLLEPSGTAANGAGRYGNTPYISLKWKPYQSTATSYPYSWINMNTDNFVVDAHHQIRVYAHNSIRFYPDYQNYNDRFLNLAGFGDTAGYGNDFAAFKNMDVQVIDTEGEPRGYYLRDKVDVAYPALLDNGSNLWIGASQSAARHHAGGVCISSGYDTTNSKGNDSIYISIPNTANDGSTSYKVWHAGNLKTGTIVEKAASNASRASGSNINFNNVSLAAGTWLVVACFGFGSNTSGVRAGKLTTTSADTSTLTEGQATLSPPSAAMRFTVSRIFSLSATTTVYAVGYQNSGSSINGQASIKAVRII